MSLRAWIYVLGVIIAGVAVTLVVASALPPPPASQWLIFAILTVLATAAQFSEAEAPGHNSYYPHLAFFYAGLVLLHPLFFIGLVTVPHLLEWIRKRWTRSDHLRAWYIQPFNIATHILAGFVARWVIVTYDPAVSLNTSTLAIFAVLAGALVYAFFDHAIIALVLALARGVSLRESKVLTFSNISTDLILLCVGYVVAVLWLINPWLTVPALSPLVLIYRALTVPQLQKDAQTDEKTGLWNARHWNTLFAAEIERSRRHGHPVAVIMADLDLLRNINNTYGHLAGDAVLAGVGRIIRETTRSYDIAGRFGGEEFAIVLPETSLEEAQSVAERLRTEVAEEEYSVPAHPHPIRATVSLGIACFPQDADLPRELIHKADLALYQAKLGGRNRVTAIVDVEPQIVSSNSFTLPAFEIQR